jgi:protein-tyrosine phosphatase
MINKTIFVGRATAETTHGWHNWAIISITEPGLNDAAKLLSGWHSVLRCEFFDFEAEMAQRPFMLMTNKEAEAIVEFVHAAAPNVEGILIHCKAGISRSAAVAKWIAQAYQLPFNHEYDRYNKHVFNLLIDANNNVQQFPTN